MSSAVRLRMMQDVTTKNLSFHGDQRAKGQQKLQLVMTAMAPNDHLPDGVQQFNRFPSGFLPKPIPVTSRLATSRPETACLKASPSVEVPKRVVSAIQAAVPIIQHLLQYGLRRANRNTAPAMTRGPPNRCDELHIGSGRVASKR
eukprot:scaffold242540_cov15-Prasinocladus_malaysianus.AAC.1